MMNKNRKNYNCHYRDCEAITDNLSRIKKEFAGILGSCVASPRMTVSVLTLAVILSFSITSESWAGCEGCEGECNYVGWGYNCNACKDGYELIEMYDGHTCRQICAEDEVQTSGNRCIKNSVCEGGTICRARGSSDRVLSNCCYKVEGDTTTMYPYDENSEFYVYAADIPANTKLVISDGARGISGELLNGFETVYIGENSRLEHPYGAWCQNNMPKLKHVIVPDNSIADFYYNCGPYKGDIVCLGDLDNCKDVVSHSTIGILVSPTESQCNGSGSYYYTGSSCEHRPEDPDDMVCTGGYARLKNNCVDPLKTFAKKHYTPAEAAQWLKDDDNEITITFKK